MVRRGLVLSGGGAMGAYQAGALRALHEAGIEFEAISATSIGSINAAGWNIPEVIVELHKHWIAQATDLKPFDPRRLFQLKNPVQFHAALDRLVDHYRAQYPFDNQRSEIYLTVTDMASRRLKTVSTQDSSISRADRELFLKASTAILHIGSAPVTIGGRRYYDGGYYNNVPIEPLLDLDLDEIWVIPLSPIQGYPRYRRTRPVNLEQLRKGVRFTLGHTLVGFSDQLLNPPSMDRGNARKIIISPFASKVMTPKVVMQSLMFTPAGITHLTDAGYRDAVRIVDDYSRTLA